MLSRRVRGAIALGSTLSVAAAVPSGFPSTGNGLWYTTPSRVDTYTWSEDWLPVGNGVLGAMVAGQAGTEMTQLNIESLWSGGPFQNSSYNGGNKQPNEAATMAADLKTIRQAIFESPNGTIQSVEQLATNPVDYGSYAGAGYLFATLDVTGTVSDFFRWLDLDQAVHRTSWTQDNSSFFRETFCSNPIQACIQRINTTDGSALPSLTFAYSLSPESGMPTPTISCFDSNTLQVNGNASSPGMAFEILARVSTGGAGASVTCTPSGSNATITVTGASEAAITWVGGTNYDMDAGDEAHDFSFKGPEPHDALVQLIGPATSAETSYDSIFAAHVEDFQGVVSGFKLDIGQKPDFGATTDALVAAYRTDTGNPYLEWLVFNYGRYLLASSARGVLPANLQGKWGKDSSNPWGADYHANINLQMNYWFAEMTAMDVVNPVFNYIEKTWVPRGEYTAKVLYNISEGWVVHDEENIFGHTGMKTGGASYADNTWPNAWMMLHVWDHMDFTQDSEWFKAQGWPLLKSVAQFHLQNLFEDLRFNDGTMVANPCNSPEQYPITMGCAHAQQLVWMLFNAIEKGFKASGDTDTKFLNDVLALREKMDKGVHIGSWGQLQEWKVDMDSPTDTHRHLSHLIGLYPGYALTSFNETLQNTAINFTRAEVLAAVETSLIHRGNGTGPDADSGWEKVWRAACWAQLANATEFYHELTYSIERNFGNNLFSLYTPDDPDIFQIDANFGFPAALLNGLVQAPDEPSLSNVYQVNLLPALPSKWPTGSITGVRLRGGFTLDLAWAPAGITALNVRSGGTAATRAVRFMHGGKEMRTLTLGPNMNVKIV